MFGVRETASPWRLLPGPVAGACGVVFALAVSGEALAGSWLRSEGEYRYSASLDYATADRYFTADGSRRDRTDCETRDFYLHQGMEYGYSYYHTLFGKFTVEQASCGEENSTKVSDLELGVRSRLDPFRNGLAWEAILILPTASDNGDPARLGQGRFGIELGAYGRFPLGAPPEDAPAGVTVGAPSHLSAGMAIQIREGGVPARLKADLGYDWRWGKNNKLSIGADADLTVSSGGIGSDRAEPGSYDRASVTATLSHRPSRANWSLYYQASQVVWGRNTDERLTIGVGISWIFRD